MKCQQFFLIFIQYGLETKFFQKTWFLASLLTNLTGFKNLSGLVTTELKALHYPLVS
jgi:hypothetical protein